MWIATTDFPTAASHPFYTRLNQLLKGKTIGVDATTLEANAALRSIVRRDSGESYEEFLTTLAKASGIGTPTRADLARIDLSWSEASLLDPSHDNQHLCHGQLALGSIGPSQGRVF
jgi:hypothetical protein